MISRLLLHASESKKLEDLISRMRLTRGLVSRYVAGTTLEEALAVTAGLKRQGIDVSLDLLGESVADLKESERATQEYVQAIKAIPGRVPGSTISVKPSQLGIVVDPDACARNLSTLLETAADHGVAVEVDMEHSSVGPGTLEIYRTLLKQYPDTRVAMQAAVRRTQGDLESFTEHKPRIRLVKGAFNETLAVAVQDKEEVTIRYQELSEWALANLPDPAFGTHDDKCIAHVKATAERLGVDRRDFEFQMLYGVRRKLWTELVQQGYRVRIYLPYGTHWYPYLMRRMAERPANLLLFLRSLIGD
ncbi:proline dehydrogenase family protein [Geodermatophilus normandii]|uniref:proline dehydrogenase n=1 Tax=Geodermatophilus normandii TaxID=1137989 RepID=A0A6P0GIG9_9ACTN|nr:proline dehydrogenase family protein [Geodermatophilus normandii]NEM07078.1 proline dehydrogenase [Geodermatophilus normandii]